MDQSSKPTSPIEVLRAQQRELARVAELIERLTTVATNKNAEVSQSVEAAQKAIKGQIEALARAEAAADRAATNSASAGEYFSQQSAKIISATKALIETERGLKSIIGTVREQRIQRYFIAGAFIAGLLILPILSFVPGLNTGLAALVMHDWPTSQGIKMAGKIIYYSVK